MRAIFGVLSLLIMLAVVGSLALQQRGAVGGAVVSTSASAAAAPQHSAAIQDKVREDTVRALQQGTERTERAAAEN